MYKYNTNDLALFNGKTLFTSFRTTMNLEKPDEEVFYYYTKKSFEKRHFTNNGPVVQELERKLAMFHGVKNCICVCNATSGIILAISAIATKNKTEIILPAFTYHHLVSCIKWAGFTPRFCDIDSKTLAASPTATAKQISAATAMILAPHPRLHLCDVEELEALAKVHNIPLLFDSVEACGCEYRGKKIGSFGHCEVFSMHPSKVLNACEGGYITTNNNELAAKLRSMRAFGFVCKDNIQYLGLNAKMNELHAAMALASLSRVSEILKDNEEQHLAYQEALAGLPGFVCIPYETHEQRNWRSLVVRLEPEWPFTRDETLALLNAENIHARAYYPDSQHTAWHESAGEAVPSLPVSEWAAQCHLLLPFGSTMSIEDVKVVGTVLRELYAMKDEVKAALSCRKAHEK